MGKGRKGEECSPSPPFDSIPHILKALIKFTYNTNLYAPQLVHLRMKMIAMITVGVVNNILWIIRIVI